MRVWPLREATFPMQATTALAARNAPGTDKHIDTRNSTARALASMTMPRTLFFSGFRLAQIRRVKKNHLKYNHSVAE